MSNTFVTILTLGFKKYNCSLLVRAQVNQIILTNTTFNFNIVLVNVEIYMDQD